MEHKHIVASLVVLGLIVIGMFVFAYIKKTEIDVAVQNPNTPTVTESPYANITRIDAKHFFMKGTHTVVGEIPMPTPCDLLNWSTQMRESNPEGVTIDFAVINHSPTCAQVVTAQRFKVSFVASEQATIGATLQGRKVELNLIPAGKDETPEDFELFIKG